VTEKLAAKGDATFRKLAGGKAAAVMLHGEQCSFPEVLRGYDAVIDWIKQNGHKVAGSPREIWLGEEGPGMKLEVVWPFQLCVVNRQI
jgi:effector-binding domain-containing protein